MGSIPVENFRHFDGNFDIGNPFSRTYNAKLNMMLTGTTYGSCSVKGIEGQDRVTRWVSGLMPYTSFIAKPRIAFSNVVSNIYDYQLQKDFQYPTDVPECDGLYFEHALEATSLRREPQVLFPRILIPNADCPTAVLVATDIRGNMCGVVCHVGLKTLAHERSILDNAYARITAKMGDDFYLQVFAGMGARNCCYGLDWERNINKPLYEQLSERFSLEHGTVKYGPRIGQAAFDIERLIVENVEELHPHAAITTLGFCTSCHGMINKDVMGFGDFFSNLRDESNRAGRNGCFISVIAS